MKKKSTLSSRRKKPYPCWTTYIEVEHAETRITRLGPGDQEEASEVDTSEDARGNRGLPASLAWHRLTVAAVTIVAELTGRSIAIHAGSGS